MVNELLGYIGGIVITIWGIAHIFPTKKVILGFGTITQDNKLILMMSWIAEGLTMIFIGMLAILFNLSGSAQSPASIIVYRAAGLMLIIMTALTLLTGSRTAVIFFKLCPIVTTIVAILYLVGSML
jgi:hypothetical protein